MSRSQKLHGRIRRILTQNNVSSTEIIDDEIYDALAQAQKQIFGRVGFERKYSLILQKDQSDYPLQSGWNLNALINSEANALNPNADVEANASTGWAATAGTLVSQAGYRAGSTGIYDFKYTVGTYDNDQLVLSGISPKHDSYHYLSIYLKASVACDVVLYLANDQEEASNLLQFSVTTSWTKFDGYFYLTGEANELRCYSTLADNGDWLEMDDMILVSSSPDFISKNVFKTIKQFILPSTWVYKLDFVSENDWNEIVNSGDTTPQPIKAVLFGNVLTLFPTPLVSGEIIELWTIMKLPETDIYSNVDPELDEEWDDALESYALYKFIGDSTYITLFENQLKEMRKNKVNKGFCLQKKRLF